MFYIWWKTLRPKTLSLSLAPVLLATALAWHEQQFLDYLIFFATLFSALAIQAGTNLYNDAADYERGADNEHRIGPDRALQQGWLSARQIKIAAGISFIIAFILGIFLAWHGGLPIVILGLVSITCGYAYTGGAKPIAYSPLGEIFVFIFFGLAAVTGTFYLQTHTVTATVILWASALGFIAAAVLLINNYRDLDTDVAARKLTIVYYFGRSRARIVYVMLLSAAYLVPVVIWMLPPEQYAHMMLLPLLSLPLAIKAVKNLYTMPVSAELNRLLAQTAGLQLVYCLLACAGLLL